MDLHPVVIVQHPAGKRVRCCQAKHEGAESNALYHAAYTNDTGASHGSEGHQAAAAIAVDPRHANVLHQNRHCALPVGKGKHLFAPCAIGLHVHFANQNSILSTRRMAECVERGFDAIRSDHLQGTVAA